MKKRFIQNVAIFFLFFIALKDIWTSLPFRYIDLDQAILKHTLTLSILKVHHIMTFISGLLMLLLSYNLFRRIRIAWLIEVFMLAISIAAQMLRLHHLTLPFVLLDVFVLVVLLFSYKDFSRQSDHGSVKAGLGYLLISLALVFFNTAVGIFMLKGKIHGVATFYDAAYQTIRLFVFMDTSLFGYTSRIGKIYLDTVLLVYWFSSFIGLIALMKPLLYEPLMAKHLKNQARAIVNAHGQNPLSYLALEDDKLYFFSKNVEGLCAYTVVYNVMVICGDIICAKEDAFIMLSELMAFARENHYSLFFMNVTEHFKSLYESAQFGLTKSGEEASFDLSLYNLSGGSGAKMRAAINHATKHGIVVKEINPLSSNDEHYVRQMKAISKEWLGQKNSPELIFTLGTNNFNTPMDRRYFCACDSEDVVWGYIVYNPYLNGKGYMAEVTRRRQQAPRGVMEKINFEAFMQMKSEGVLETTLGLSPLYNVASEGKGSLDEKLFTYIYENMNHYYDFMSLHRAKEKYAPTHWKPRYYAYYPKPFMPQYAYAIVRAQLPHSILTWVSQELKTRFTAKKDRDENANREDERHG